MTSIQDELPNLKRLVQMLAAQFGRNSEIVLHDLSREYEHTIVAIENNWITGRNVGDGGTNLGLEVLRNPPSLNGDIYNYFNKTPNGRTLRSSTLYFRDEEGKVVGSLCINTDITEIVDLQDSLRELAMLPQEQERNVEEVFANRVEDLVDYFTRQSEKTVGKPVAEMTKEEKIEALRYLDEKGFFLINRSGDEACRFFGMSKFTLYKYLGIIRGKSADGNSADGNSTDGNSTDGNSADGNSADGNSTDGNSADGNSTDGNSTDETENYTEV